MRSRDVASPETGYAYLDAATRRHGPGCWRSRTAAAPSTPRSTGLENTLARVPARARPRLRLPRDRRPRHPRRRAARVPRRRPGPGHRRPRGDLADLTAQRGRSARCRAAASRCPTLAAALRRVPRRPLQHRPQVRRGRCAALADFVEDREVHDRVLVGSFSRRRLGEFRRLTGGRVPDLRRTRSRWSAFRLLPSGRLADLRHPRPRCGCSRSRTGAGGSPSPRAGLVRRAHARRQARARLDHRRPRRDARAARPWCRRPDDRPHRHTQGRARPSAGQWRGSTMSDTRATGASPTSAAGADQGAEGLVLVRLGQQRLRHHHRRRAVRAVPHLGRRGQRLRQGVRRRLRLRRPACRSSASTSRPAPWSSTWSRRRPSSPRWCCRSSARSPTGRRGKTTLMARFAWAGARTGDADVLRRRRQLAARRAAPRRRDPVPRRQPGGLRRDPVRDRRARRARPGLLARLGARLPRRRHPARH